MRTITLALISFILALTCTANEVQVFAASVAKTDENTYRFDVTLKHEDTGWQHYANKWEVISLSGKVLGTRILYHPHENEQPFTRSLSGVNIPQGQHRVIIRAYDSLHGLSSNEFSLELPNK